SRLNPEEAAEQVREAWGLGENSVSNVVHLLEANGVRFFSLPSDCLDIDTFSIISEGTPFILLSSLKSCERIRFDTAHELGHLLLHRERRVSQGRDLEGEANDFASAFLMPRAGMLAQHLHNASIDRILIAKRKWGVSAIDLTHRLRKLELISDRRYNQTVKELARRGYRRAEPGSSLARESSLLLAKAFEALRNILKMSPAEVAAELHTFPEHLNEYVFGMMLVAFDGGREQSAPLLPELRIVQE
ncbi:ImmA/IrrE family metallo-endopeptidase, partial [Streptomyces sp. NPDC058855]|uniref:ImmA/IrrE family metallo-endopeptidase n=1 Tax=Streptomyces sp. NPDC058855 TaxID=3346651 RepID=UPI0036B125A6